MAESSRTAKKRKASETTDSHWEAGQALAEDPDKAAGEKQTKETPQALQAVHGLSMAPYAASELAHFSNERLIKYIIDLQEQVGKLKSESPIKAEDEPTHTPLTSTETKAAEKESGLPFFGDGKPGIDLEQEKAFHLEVMQTRATMKWRMLRHFQEKDCSNALTTFAIEVQSKRVIEELFGSLLGWETGLGGRRKKRVFVYDLDVSLKVQLGIRSLRSSMLTFFQT